MVLAQWGYGGVFHFHCRGCGPKKGRHPIVQYILLPQRFWEHRQTLFFPFGPIGEKPTLRECHPRGRDNKKSRPIVLWTASDSGIPKFLVPSSGWQMPVSGPVSDPPPLPLPRQG